MDTTVETTKKSQAFSLTVSPSTLTFHVAVVIVHLFVHLLKYEKNSCTDLNQKKKKNPQKNLFFLAEQKKKCAVNTWRLTTQ